MSNLSLPIKAILFLSLPVVIATGIIFLLSKRPSIKTQSPKPTPNQATQILESTSEAEPLLPLDENASLEDKVADLEIAVTSLSKKVDALTKQPAAVVNQTIPTQAPAATTTTTTTTQTGAKSVYIPIGSAGSSVSVNTYESIGSQEVIIDPANYPGYRQMVFEANMRIFQANGTGYARLFNKTDGTAVLNSEVSTTSGTYGIKGSSGFSLSSGAKTYTVQLKTTTGYSVDLQTTRIRVDF